MSPRSSRRGIALIASAIAIASSVGCFESRRLAAQLEQLEQQRAQVSADLSQRQEALTSLQGQLATQQAGLDEYKTRVVGYMLEHKMAVAAIAAGTVGAEAAIDTTNAFSQDARNLGAAVGVMSAIYALANAGEVIDVSKTLSEANAHVRTLQAELAQTQTSIDQATSTLSGGQSALADLDRQIAEIKAKLQ